MSDTDFVLYCRDSLMAAGIRHLLLARRPSVKVKTITTVEAASAAAASGYKMVTVLSEDLPGILEELGTLIHLQQSQERTVPRHMVLYNQTTRGLQTLIPSAYWVCQQVSAAQMIQQILCWLNEPIHLKLPALLSELTSQQRNILILLARGMRVRDVATELGISAKTVSAHRFDIQTRLGTCRHTGWILLCALLPLTGILGDYADNPVSVGPQWPRWA